jgi:hypothetical protein
MGFSSSQSSNPQTTSNTQATLSGASGANSPTIWTNGAVSMTDEGATRAALAGMSTVTLAVLDEQNKLNQESLGMLSDFNANQAATEVKTSNNSNDLLASVLANNQALAQNVQSGGATTGMTLTTKVVTGAMVLMGLLIALMLFRK